MRSQLGNHGEKINPRCQLSYLSSALSLQGRAQTTRAPRSVCLSSAQGGADDNKKRTKRKVAGMQSAWKRKAGRNSTKVTMASTASAKTIALVLDHYHFVGVADRFEESLVSEGMRRKVCARGSFVYWAVYEGRCLTISGALRPCQSFGDLLVVLCVRAGRQSSGVKLYMKGRYSQRSASPSLPMRPKLPLSTSHTYTS
jgi:hypothetical protein